MADGRFYGQPTTWITRHIRRLQRLPPGPDGDRLFRSMLYRTNYTRNDELPQVAVEIACRRCQVSGSTRQLRGEVSPAAARTR